MYYQGKALKKRKGRMKIAGAILLLIGAAIIMAGMVMCNAKIFAHGEGACDGEWRISHTMPDWWSSQADWDLKHRHHIQRSNKRDYVQSWTNQSPQMDTFSECPETSTTDIATTSVDDETDAERTNDGYCDPEPIFSTNKAGRLASVVWLEQGTNKVCPRQPDQVGIREGVIDLGDGCFEILYWGYSCRLVLRYDLVGSARQAVRAGKLATSWAKLKRD